MSAKNRRIVFLNCYLEKEGINKRQRIPKGQSKMDNPEKLATQGTQDEEIQKHNTTQHKMCWTPLCAKTQIT